MLEAALEGFTALLTPQALIFLGLGVGLGVLFGFLPGLGGIAAMAMLLPFVFGVEPAAAMALLLGAHVATVYNTAITSVLFGIPGASKTISMCFDGHPMTQRGEGVRALRATAVSAAIGGLAGVVFLIAAMPLLLKVMLAVAEPEYLVLGFWALALIAVFSEGYLLKGVCSAGLGLLLSFIGQDPVSSTPRYTFGSLYLFDGVNLAVVFLGLFAVSQMIALYLKEDIVAPEVPPESRREPLLDGVFVTFRHKMLLLRASLFGIFIGAMPGVGATLGGLASYGQAVQTTRNPEPEFGKGNVRGVIAPAATIGANEGSELLPTLGLAIPGGESSAMLLSALLVLGVTPGPKMFQDDMPLVFSIVWVIVVAFLLTSLAGYLTAPLFSRITRISTGKLVPLIIAVCLAGAYAIHQRVGDVILAAVMGIAGYFLKKHHFSLGAIAVGLVLGQLIERWLNISLQVYGTWFIFERPVALVLAILAVVTVVWPLLNTKGMAHRSAAELSHELDSEAQERLGK